MIKQGIARLVAALIAAISLHALIFTLLSGQQEPVQLNPFGSLQVELLAQQEVVEELQSKPEKIIVKALTPSLNKAAEQSVLKNQPKQDDVVPQKTIDHPAPITVADNKAVSFVVVEKESITEKVAEAVEPVEPVEVTQAEPLHEPLFVDDYTDENVEETVTQMNVMPQHIQAEIAARVSYPRQARRRGWQGEAQFLLNINEQTVRAVTMLASTGYPILDRAAQRGLSSVNHIPLSNGLYHMPVSFRLQ